MPYFQFFWSVNWDWAINGSTEKWHTHWSKFDFDSRSIMDKMVNQHINRILRTMPYFSSDCPSFQSTYQQGILLALGKIWAFFLVSVVNFGKSTDQRGSARYTLFPVFLVSDLKLGDQPINRDMTHSLVKIWMCFSVSNGQDGKSTHQQEYARYTSFLLWLLQFLINISTGNFTCSGKNLSFFLGQYCQFW